MESNVVYKKLEEQDYIENKGDILANKYYHLMFPNGEKAISNIDVQNIDGKEWEIFCIHSETEKAYYGTPLEGFGLVNCMILKEDTRDFLPEEIEKLNTHHYGIGSMVHKLTIEPLKSKWKKETTEEYFNQYIIAGYRDGKWYREHPNFRTLELAEEYLNQERDKKQFKRYTKFKIQCRKITKWEDLKDC